MIIVGSAAIDITARARLETDDALAKRSTAPGAVSMSLGGVARNIAEASHRVITSQSPYLSSMLVSPIGNDSFGRLLVGETRQLGMRVDGFVQSDKGTAICNMILDGNGGLIGGVADMDITTDLTGDIVAFSCCFHLEYIAHISPIGYFVHTKPQALSGSFGWKLKSRRYSKYRCLLQSE